MPINVVAYTKGMTLNSPIYLDSNFPLSYIYHGHPKYQVARDLWVDLAIQKIEVFISAFTFDEAWHKLRSYFDLNINRLSYTDTVTRLTNSLMGFPSMKFLPKDCCMAQNSIQNASYFLTQQNLKATDSFHLALATLSSVSGFVTSDSDFDNINLPNINLTVYKY